MLAWQVFVKILQLPRVAGAPLLVERQLPVAQKDSPVNGTSTSVARRMSGW